MSGIVCGMTNDNSPHNATRAAADKARQTAQPAIDEADKAREALAAVAAVAKQSGEGHGAQVRAVQKSIDDVTKPRAEQ